MLWWEHNCSRHKRLALWDPAAASAPSDAALQPVAWPGLSVPRNFAVLPSGCFGFVVYPSLLNSQVSCAVWSDVVLIPVLSTVIPQDSYLTRDSPIQADQDSLAQLDPLSAL